MGGPEQWGVADPTGRGCVFCRRTIAAEDQARGVWDLDQVTGWQVLGFHLACLAQAERERRSDGRNPDRI